MTFTVEKTKSGSPFIIFNNVKYRQKRILRNGDVSWLCLLGKNCGASIKTDANMTRVTVCNDRHTGDHAVTMSSLLSPLTKPRPAAASSSSTPPASAATSAPSTPPTPTTPPAPVCSTPDPGLTLVPTTPGPADEISIAPVSAEDPAAEVSRLKKEIERLKSEFKILLDHTVESDSRLLQFTDQIFTMNTSRVDQTARASARVDRGVQCDPPSYPPEDPVPVSVDFGAQCDLWCTACTRCAEITDILNSLKTTIEVLQAENQCLKNQLRTCEDVDVTPTHPWIEKNRQTSQTPIPHFRSINIRGDSHSHHISGLVKSMTFPPASVGDMCMPGAGLLDILRTGHTPPRSGTHCEVLIAGSNDLAVGKQHVIYRHLEAHITARPANTELVLVTLPLRHDLESDHPIHDETVLVNAYIEELAVRHNIRVVNFNNIGRRHFTRHGQHLSMRGKQLLAGMVVKTLALLRPRVSAPPLHIVAAAPAPTVPAPAAASGESADTLHQSPRFQHATYAEALRGSPTPGSVDESGRSPEQKNLENIVRVKPV
ncbi:hypothetical protein J6590_098208 [Homalodisca vitripennis]|nr:hypothetical protein J6590_098208 [Homalodisca vitripennis]